MTELRDKILNLIAEAKPAAAESVAIPVSVGALYAARMNIPEDVFLKMCERALNAAREVWRKDDLEVKAKR